ncbi:fad binding domain-containing protein [Moniliophthora roreri]|uniref:FAD-binding PCMH-type domain-containing protein n=1 Tax=Moniliophthora roreri TaxID=221103 RepID=A0A0W0G755_MONRR|nr:fad binding domain-containing protein [Moniliophthora roreri]
MWARALFVFIISAVAVKSEHNPQEVLRANTDNAVEKCCSDLTQRWPALVSFTNEGSHYYAVQQAEQQPRCRFTPLSSQHVSTVVGLLSQNSCRFAVRSGGHGLWAGMSNIDNGVVIDLTKMRGVEVKPEQNMVTLEPGSTWEEVYRALERWNITVGGGRVSSVGVGGFMMGGGISFLSYEQGFASDNVINYEIVLSDGTIVNANANSHPDLYWALKLGSTNYGIVTRFDMFTSPLSSKISAGVQVFDLSKDVQGLLLEKWFSYIDNLSSDTKEAAWVFLAPKSRQIGLVRANLESELLPYPSITPVTDTTQLLSLADFTKSIEAIAGLGKRTSWYTITILADLALMDDSFSLMQDASGTFEKSGAELYCTVQPISKGFIAASRDNPVHNVLAEQDSDLVLTIWGALWDDPAQDTLVGEALVKFGESVEGMARQRGLLNEFVYLNYAHEHQKVYERSISREKLARMVRIKEKYDKGDVFGRLWQGGYKLPKGSSDGGHRTEL